MLKITSKRYYILFPSMLILLMLLLYKQPVVEEHNVADWNTYKTKFITHDGRVTDSGNGNISHSEGQGYGMLLAVHFNDHIIFKKILDWTKNNLNQRSDNLFSWKFEPGKGVTDSNNATDGDILIAWALLKAAVQWHRPDYEHLGKKILLDIRQKLTKTWQELTTLLPAEKGFSQEQIITVNLSYWVYPAFEDFQKVDPSPQWDQLIESGLQLGRQARFGKWLMPPDWLDLKDSLSVSEIRSPNSGYDAVRIPLYRIWGGKMTREEAENYRAFRNYYRQEKGYLPPVINLVNDQTSNYPAPQGINAIYDLQDSFLSQKPYEALQPLGADEDYYSSTLYLLALIASKELWQE